MGSRQKLGIEAPKNHLAVRDYLRTQPVGRVAYSTLKKALAKRFGKERERYVQAKTDFILPSWSAAISLRKS
jgi:GrpB-like predicted nucleotidyltransferase (UPF0157 family)